MFFFKRTPLETDCILQGLFFWKWASMQSSVVRFIYYLIADRGEGWSLLQYYIRRGRVAHVARAALTERSGSSTKGRTPMRKSVLSRFTRFFKGFYRALNESHPAFVELSAKVILLSERLLLKNMLSHNIFCNY